MSWLWGRKDSKDTTEGSGAQPELLAVSRGEWRSLAPIQRVLPEHPLVNPAQRFSSSLAAWQSPAYLAPLGHRVSTDDPSGTADLARPVTVARAVDMPVGRPPKTSRPQRVPLLSRIRDAVLQRSAEEAVPSGTTEAEETPSFDSAGVEEVLPLETALPVADGPSPEPAPKATLGQAPALPQVQRAVEGGQATQGQSAHQVPASLEPAGPLSTVGVQRTAEPLPVSGAPDVSPVPKQTTLDSVSPSSGRGSRPVEVQRVSETLPAPGATEPRVQRRAETAPALSTSEPLPLLRLQPVQPVQRTTQFTKAGPVDLPMLRLPSVAAPVVARTAEPQVSSPPTIGHEQPPVTPQQADVSLEASAAPDADPGHSDTVGTVGAATGSLDAGAGEAHVSGAAAASESAAGVSVDAVDLPSVQRTAVSQDADILPLRSAPKPQYGDNLPSPVGADLVGGQEFSQPSEPSLPLADGQDRALSVGGSGAGVPDSGVSSSSGFDAPTLSRLVDPTPGVPIPAPTFEPATPTPVALDVATPSGLNVQRSHEADLPAPEQLDSAPNSPATVDSDGAQTVGVLGGTGITAFDNPPGTGSGQQIEPDGSNAQVSGALNAPVVSESSVQTFSGLGEPSVQRTVEGWNATAASSAPLLGVHREPSTPDPVPGSGSFPAGPVVSRTVEGNPPVVQRSSAAPSRRLGLGAPLVSGASPGPAATPISPGGETPFPAPSEIAPLTGEAPLEAPPPPETVQRQDDTAAPGEALPIAALPVARALAGIQEPGQKALPPVVAPVTVSRLIGDRAPQPVLGTGHDVAQPQTLTTETVRTPPRVQELVPPPAPPAPTPPVVQTVVQPSVPVMTGPVEVSVQREETGAAPAEVGTPPPAAAAESGTSAAPPPAQAAAPAQAQSPDELVKKLFDPLLRLLKTELRLDRERRGALTDRWH